VSVEFCDTELVYRDMDGNSLAAVADAISQKDEAGKAEWLTQYDYEVTGDNLSR
jgi:hypothetical protein